jgi:multidrug efflux pump subunit AcrB
MKSFNLSAWAVAHRPLVLFLLLSTLIAGVFSFTRLGRLEDPVFEVPSMTVTVAWPGASAQQVQDQVLNRLERALQELDGLDNVRSFARQGFGGITLWMQGGTDKAGLDAAWYQARKKIGDIRHELPQGVRGPFFNDEFTDVYGLLYALSAPDLGFPELQALAEDVKRALQAVPGVVKVDVLGRQAEQVQVEFSSQRLAAMGLTPQLLMDALARQSVLPSAGAVDGAVDRGVVRVAGAPGGAGQVAALPIAVGGRLLKLGDVADVRPALEDPPSFTVRRNGEPVLALGLVLSRHANVLEVGTALDAATAALAPRLPLGVALEKYADQPQVVEDAVWEFERAFLEALAIVLAVCFVALGWRSGVVVAASVPLVLGLVAIVMYWRGWALDRISLGALIIALGLLVDDAIIAVEMMVVKIEEGWDRVRAAGFAWTSTAFPMLTGTLVTVAGFMPVGFAHSISGQYAGGIFWVVGVALLASWVVAVLFTPYLGVKLLPRVMKAHAHGTHDGPLYARLRRGVDWAVAHRGWVLGGTLALFLAAGAGMGLVQQQFFPTASRTELLVDLQLREGASFAATQAQVRRVEAILKADAEVQGFTAYTGAGTPRFFLSLSPELPNPGYAQFVVQTASIAAREAVRERLRAVFDAGETFPDVRGRVQRLEFGPPVGYPVQFRVIGPDVAEVRRIAARVRDLVRQSPLVRDTHLEWNEQVRSVRVEVDQDRAELLGLSTQEISAMVQTALSGAPVAQLRRGEELIDVVLRAVPGERRALEQLQDLPVFTRTGQSVPLSQLARLEPDWEEPVLWRRNRDMTLSVRSDLADGVQGPYATQQIWPTLRAELESLPPGYRIEQGGAVEESDKSNRALFAVFPAMFAVTLLILMLQLQSFSRMALVFLTAPLGLIGVVPALLAFNAPFGFVALLGVIALGGMIMRNAVILVDQIDRDIAAGSAPWVAIVEATVRRARPVVLTAAAAILAMVPLTRSIFWGPMAMSIMGGLVVATALTLVFVPALYAAWFRVRREAGADAASQLQAASATPA